MGHNNRSQIHNILTTTVTISSIFIKDFALLRVNHFSTKEMRSNLLYTDAYNRIFSRYKTFQLDIDIGENIIPYLLNEDGYAFVPRKMVEKELSNELLFEIEIVDEQIPPMNNYVIYKSTSPKRKLIQQWLNEVAAD